MQKISSADFIALRQKDANLQVLDVRTTAEFRSCRIGGNVVNIPLDEISVVSVQRLVKDVTKPLYVMCRTQNRAIMAVERLQKEGLTNLIVVDGGVTACTAKGLDTQGEGGFMDIERQVRLIAGVLVLLGFILGLYVAPIFHVLSGLVGLGLILAGATGWCGMALILSKAPWNRT